MIAKRFDRMDLADSFPSEVSDHPSKSLTCCVQRENSTHRNNFEDQTLNIFGQPLHPYSQLEFNLNEISWSLK